MAKNEVSFTGFKKYDCNNPVVGSAEEEWMPHATMSDKTTEWWYLTVMAQDNIGRNYFLFFTANLFSGEVWTKHMGFTPVDGKNLAFLSGRFRDYSNSQHLSYSSAAMVDADTIWDSGRNAISFDVEENQADWSYDNGRMNLRMKTADLEYDLEIDGREVTWHKDKLGHLGMIQQGAPDDFSFYYSIMRGGLHGTLTYRDDKGKKRDLRLTGEAYIDRQWGDFLSVVYEWTSFRFVNGARLHFYNFASGHQEGVYLTADGKVQYFDGVIVRQNGYAKSPNLGIWISHGWSYEFPIEIEGSKKFTVKPFNSNDMIEFPAMKVAVFSGPGELVNDTTGEVVGTSVNESGDIRIMKNEPYGENQR